MVLCCLTGDLMPDATLATNSYPPIFREWRYEEVVHMGAPSRLYCADPLDSASQADPDSILDESPIEAEDGGASIGPTRMLDRAAGVQHQTPDLHPGTEPHPEGYGGKDLIGVRTAACLTIDRRLLVELHFAASADAGTQQHQALHLRTLQSLVATCRINTTLNTQSEIKFRIRPSKVNLTPCLNTQARV